ncbi:unnamed protein product, partial [Choristocarpus tenellus]
ERSGKVQWARSFQHERGNWPTYNVDMHFRGRSPVLGMIMLHSCLPLLRSLVLYMQLENKPVEVVVNDLESTSVQHLSLSKTFVLRAHQIQPFTAALGKAVENTRRFTIVVTGKYDVLVNEDKTRSFLCLRTVGGTRQVLDLIDKVDLLLQKYRQPTYYEVILYRRKGIW